jgi:MFS family permease
VQGVGAAIISPATLSIITTTFEEGPSATRRSASGERWGSGAAAGVLFGGILTKYAGWE